MATHRMAQPTARQVRLGSILRGLREDGTHGSQAAVAGELGWSESKLSRVETGRLGLTEPELNLLLDRYAVKDRSLRGYIFDLRRRGKVRGWETRVRSDKSAVYADYIGYESDAAEMYSAQTTLIPGLLQTHDYAAAVFHQQRPDATDRHDQLEIRDKRREVFDRPRPLVFWGVLSESVFRHAIGGPEVMAAQLEHLLNMAKDYPGTINIHVLPEKSESHGALFGPFVILSFPQRWEPDIVYLDGFTSTKFLEDTEQVQEYNRLFRRLMMTDSLRGPESLKLIERHLDDYRKDG
ncbi:MULTISPECIES: helix-turn-helix transcriptional regulator [unclassified Streptomyces]|uniref:helix-turn-helix domain-containing protein n=1 Tax=unclassified Streptomyces TaxID=2593676 RepID=UPI000DD8F531|nr:MULTISPECIES: helix-turn-helix transcriptional regulator [unclassified Streptomyces]QZZ28071.1 helix-turn-helix domain-containing protein [Streptomyces sp. ST1015]